MIKIIEILSTEYSATSPTPIRAHLIADTISDLPTPTGITGYQLTIGSICDVIHDSTRYTMKSDGTWVQTLTDITADVYTKAQTDALITAEQTARQSADADLLTIQQADRAAIAQVIDTGAKNILDFSGYQASGNAGLTATKNTDGSISFTGTSTTTATYFMSYTFADAKRYVISGAPENPQGITLRLRTLSNADVAVDTGSGAPFTPTAGTTYRVTIRLIAATYTGETVYPMISLKAVWDISDKYVPFSPTNAQLYAMIQAL